MLIALKQNTINDVVLTLREKSLLWIYSATTPFYLFSFINQTTKQTINFVADNISPLSAQNAYDEFLITCTGATSVNLSAGTIWLNPAITWQYNVYEQNQQYNFNPQNSVSLVETGIVQYSSQTQDFTYIKMTGNTNYVAFNTYG